MTTIKQLLDMSIGQKVGGFELTVKKYPSKMVEVGKKKIQPVTFIDETGEMIGDVLSAKYGAIQKGYKIHITVGVIQNGETGKKLYVEQWWLPSITVDEYEAKREAEKAKEFRQQVFDPEEEYIIQSKVRMHVVCAFLADENIGELSPGLKATINAYVDFIMTGQ